MYGEIRRIRSMASPLRGQDWAEWRIMLGDGKTETELWSEQFIGTFGQACDRQESQEKRMAVAP